MRRILSLLHSEISGLHEAAYLVGLSAIASQLLALVRDRLFAHTFGAGSDLDIYYAAFRIPDLIFVSVASFVSVTVLIPFLSERIGVHDRAEARQFLNSVLTVFLGVMFFVSAVAFVTIPYLAPLVAPGFDAIALEKLVVLTRILLLSPLLLGLSNIIGSVTQSLKQFYIYALSPLVYNLGIIFGILVLYPAFGLPGLAWGVAVGALGHILVQVPAHIHAGFRPALTRSISWSEIRAVVSLSLPRTLGLSFNQIALMVLVALASLIEQGSIAVFNFSYNLQSVPLAVIGVSYSVAAFPTLARLFSRGEKDVFIRQVTSALRHIVFWSVPVLTLFIVLRAQIVRTVLGSGSFNWDDTRLTAAALALFCISILAQSAVLLLVRAYYAAGNTRVPLAVNGLSSFLTVLLGVAGVAAYDAFHVFRSIFDFALRIEGVTGGGVVVLPLAYSLGIITNALVLWRYFKRDFGIRGAGAASVSFWQSCAASLTMGGVAYLFLGVLGNVLDLHSFIGIFFHGFIAGCAGIVVGVVVLRLFRNEELAEVGAFIHLKFWKSRPIAPSPEEL